MKSRLAELERLFQIGSAKAKRLTVAAKNLPFDQEIKLMAGRNGPISEFERIARAVRLIIVLEMELSGLLRIGDLEGTSLGSFLDRSDYSRGPLDEVVAGIREVLNAEPPAKDPCAPTTPRKPREAAVKPTSVTAPRPTTKPAIRRPIPAKVNAGMATAPSFKSAPLRSASTMPRVHKISPTTFPPSAKGPRGRGSRVKARPTIPRTQTQCFFDSSLSRSATCVPPVDTGR